MLKKGPSCAINQKYIDLHMYFINKKVKGPKRHKQKNPYRPSNRIEQNRVIVLHRCTVIVGKTTVHIHTQIHTHAHILTTSTASTLKVFFDEVRQPQMVWSIRLSF